jgi:outer membrane protein
MKSKILITLLVFIFYGIKTISAQENAITIPLEKISLDGAIAVSLKNSPDIIVQKIKQQKDEQELARIKTGRIPNIYLSGDLRRNIIIPSTPIPAIMMDPSASTDKVVFMKFNTDWNSGTGINLTYDIFNPATIKQTSEQRIQNKINGYESQITERELVSNVTMAYAECVIAQAQYEALKGDTAYYSKSLKDAYELYNKEKISLADKNEILISYNTSLMKFMQAGRILNSAKADLLYLLGVVVNEKNISELSTSDDIPTLYNKVIKSIPVKGTLGSSDTLSKSIRLAQQSEVISLAASRIKSSNLRYLPTVSLSGFYGTNFYGNNLSFTDNGVWHGNSYVALSLKIPLTQSITTTKEISQLKFQEQIEKENLRKMANQRNKELAEAEGQLIQYQKEYEINKKNYELSSQNLKASQSRFDKGYVMTKELLSDQLRCSNAYLSFLQAAYNVFTGSTNLEKIKVN